VTAKDIASLFEELILCRSALANGYERKKNKNRPREIVEKKETDVSDEKEKTLKRE
jgi:hypothetical protein